MGRVAICAAGEGIRPVPAGLVRERGVKEKEKSDRRGDYSRTITITIPQPAQLGMGDETMSESLKQSIIEAVRRLQDYTLPPDVARELRGIDIKLWEVVEDLQDRELETHGN